jgi:hypothetical protein
MKNSFMRPDEAIAKIDAEQPAETLTPEEALAKIKELASAGRIEFSPSDGVEALQIHVDRVLEAIGFPTAWVSDRSCIGDFQKDQSREEWAASASEKLGMIVTCGDFIVDVARRMKEMGSA